MAAKRLKTWAPQVDPDDPSHVDAYLLAKMQQKQRVSLQAVLANIKQQEVAVERSSTSNASFWVAPTSNFPKGLSTEQKQWLVTREDLASRFELPDDGTEYDKVHVFSDACPRASLGQWVQKLTFSLKLGRTTRGPTIPCEHTESAPPHTSSNDGPDIVVAPQPSPKPKLKRHLSTTSSDEEDKTLTEIIKQCSQAATAGRIYSADKANTHTVHFWATSVALSLPPTHGAAPQDRLSAVRENFGKLLTKLLINSQAYDHLHRFEEVFTKLEEKGVQIPALAAPLRKLMVYPLDSDTSLGMENVDLNATRRFFTSALWTHFEKQRAGLWLQKAKGEPHGESRDNFLKICAAVPQESQSSSTTTELDMARSLFMSTVPLSSRVKYALEHQARMEFAADWKADFDCRALVYFGTTPSTFQGLTYKGFAETYDVILKNDMLALVKNAIMKTIMEYGVSLAACTAEKTWWADFLKLTVATRLGLLVSWYGSETPVFDESLVDAESIDKVEKETAKLLANIKGDRPWMNALKQKIKELRASKPNKSSQPGITAEVENADGKTKPAAKKNTKPAEAENTKPAEAENTKPDEASQPQGTDVPSADAAASSAEAKPPSPAATEAAQRQPLPPKEKEHDPRYVPTCEVGDIVIVKAHRQEFNGFKAKVLTVLTGVVKVEMLEGPTAGTRTKAQRFKFLQVSKVTIEEAKPEPEKKEGTKLKKSRSFQNLNDWLLEATQDVP